MAVNTATAPGPGWSLLRIVTLGVLAVLVGALIGTLAGAGVVLFSGAPWPEIGSFALIAAIAGGVAGAAFSGVAALGSLCALVVGDHWGSRGPRARALIAGSGAAVAVSALSLWLVTIDYLLISLWFLLGSAVVGAMFAGAGLYLFERRMRRRALRRTLAADLIPGH